MSSRNPSTKAGNKSIWECAPGLNRSCADHRSDPCSIHGDHTQLAASASHLPPQRAIPKLKRPKLLIPWEVLFLKLPKVASVHVTPRFFFHFSATAVSWQHSKELSWKSKKREMGINKRAVGRAGGSDIFPRSRKLRFPMPLLGGCCLARAVRQQGWQEMDELCCGSAEGAVEPGCPEEQLGEKQQERLRQD